LTDSDAKITEFIDFRQREGKFFVDGGDGQDGHCLSSFLPIKPMMQKTKKASQPQRAAKLYKK
jgi:hypothetical protein